MISGHKHYYVKWYFKEKFQISEGKGIYKVLMFYQIDTT